AVWRGSTEPQKAMKAATLDWRNALERPRDVSFALDQIEKLNAQAGPLKGRLDLKNMGVAGHSFGAFTTLAIAGQKFGLREQSLADPRVKAAIPMSAPVPRQASERLYAAVKIPLLHLTGTADVSPISDTTAKERRVPFDEIQHAEQILITFNGGDHMVFSGATGPKRDASQDAIFHDLIRQSTTMFLDA